MTHLIGFDKQGRGILGGIAAALLSLGASHADTTRLIVHENFETYKTTKALRAVWAGGPAQLVTNGPGGGQSAGHDGTGMNRRGGFFVFPDATHSLVLQADFYDFGTNTDQNVTVSINGEDTHGNVAIGLKGPFCYVARVGGFSSKTNWLPFRRRQQPVPGWHRFKAEISMTNLIATVDFGIDGKVDRTLSIPFDRPPPTFTQLRFGGYAGRLAAGGTVLVDNIRLELLSLEPSAVATTASAPNGNTTLPTEAVSPSVASAPTLETNDSSSPLPNRPPVPLVGRSSIENTQTTISAAVDKAAEPQRPASPAVAVPQPPVNSLFPVVAWWIGGAFAIVIALLAVVILMLRRQTVTIPKALLTDTADGGQPTGNPLAVESAGDDHWRERALQAEAVAAKQAQILKENVGPELVEFAKETLVQGLYTQRNALLETQVKAKQTLVELEARLTELHLPAQERIQAYEKRIAELEKQLESRGDEMRELTRATLLLVQEKLEQERQQQGPRFN